MAARGSEADRLRLNRLIFERAQRDGVAMRDAREALAIERWKAVEARLSRRQPIERTELPRQWWQDQ